MEEIRDLIFCSRCGGYYSKDKRKCPHCQENIERKKADNNTVQRFCKTCGRTTWHTYHKCQTCGTEN